MAIGTADHFKIPSVLRGRRGDEVVRPSSQITYGGGGGDGGGDAPNWVPANAKIYIDLVNVRAWTAADGEVAIDTLLGSDPNSENGWGTTGYDAGDLTADGLIYTNAPPAFIGAARAKMVSGATIRYATKHTDTEISFPTYFALITADGNDAIEIDFGGNNTHNIDVYTWNGTESKLDNVANEGVAGALNVVAATITANRIEVAINGSEVVTNSDAHPDVAAIVLDTQESRPAYAPHQNQAIQYITIYDALPDTTGLSALSETGVTNTAPTDITYTQSDVFTWNDATHATTSDGGGASSASVLTGLGAIDAEGNPCAFTLTSNPSGIFSVIGNEHVQTFSESALSPGDYTFTLRATDLGGLYVEKAFTITVTA